MSAAVALLAPIAVLSVVGQDQAVARTQLREDLLSQAVVTEVSETDQVVRVDTKKDPEAAEAWLDESADVLDGWTVVVGGIDVRSGAQRQELDQEAFADDPPVGSDCPDVPDGPRSADGATTPLLGCASEDDVRLTQGAATVTKGGPSRTLATAVDDVLASYFPDAELAPTTVRMTKRAATVDVAAGFDEALSDTGVYPGDVWQALLFTAHSNGAIDSVKFTLDGDCLAFAYATGGDMCAATDLPIEMN